MAIIDFPAGVGPRAANWRQVGGVLLQQSSLGGATKALVYGPAARWMCDLEFPRVAGARARSTRGFFAAMRGGINLFRLSAADEDQHAGAPAVQVNGGGAGYVLPLKGMPVSATFLLAGHFITVVLPNGDEQLLPLSADLVADAGGAGNAQLGSPLRQVAANNAVVHTKRPHGLMRAANPVAWSVEPGPLYRHQLQAMEGF